MNDDNNNPFKPTVSYIGNGPDEMDYSKENSSISNA